VNILPLLEAEAKDRQRAGGGDRKSVEYQKSVSAGLQQAIGPQIKSVEEAAELTGTMVTGRIEPIKRAGSIGRKLFLRYKKSGGQG
jgi:hypothetical protein